jgi:riboflavin kinase / FMN adenylyltransferase
MKVIKSSFRDINMQEHLSIALGTFDGVHIGHQQIIKQAVVSAEEHNIKSAVLTFDRHPYALLRPEIDMQIITDNDTKAQLIECLDVDYLFFISFDEEFANIEAEEFLDTLKTKFKADIIVCGYNYSFGKKGRGNPQILNYSKDILHYQLKVVERVALSNQRISSSIIREKMNSGKISEANDLLGYNYFCTGIVGRGKELGKKLGFPTANISVNDKLAIRNGVYISLTYVDGKIIPSISNVGYTPTVENKHRVIETHLLNFSDDLYGKNIKVEMLDFIRDEMKFSSIIELKETVLRDIDSAKIYFSNSIYNK